ncbi:MAG: nitroreductase family protein [Anaerolineales bacterium]|nr:nitroreductase family protein [Chloroflexota bacterium]MBL6983247.1 nitroreductase family protein [Anaerolineales bacterium]
MNIRELVLKNRSYRRFFGDHAIDRQTLVELVDLARHSASGANLQPLKFFLSHTPEMNGTIFPHLGWAGYLKDWPGPVEGERPSGYIIILGDKSIKQNFGCDNGIAAQSILLGAVEKGFGGCMLASVNRRDELMEKLGLPENLLILLVIALGKPKESVVIDPLAEDGDIKYWRDAEGVHHVPKRSLDELIIG